MREVKRIAHSGASLWDLRIRGLGLPGVVGVALRLDVSVGASEGRHRTTYSFLAGVAFFGVLGVVGAIVVV